jgi:mono/diheme cytochrome c family protein
MKLVAWTLAIALTLGCAAAAAVVWAGLYDVAATKPHWQPVHDLLETTMHRSVKRHAQGLVPPADLQSPARLARGAACYRQHCLACHGGPGMAVEPLARSMQPLPGPLVDVGRRFTAGELYWIVRHGIKMSGMPAWQHRMTDADQWAVAAFVHTLHGRAPADFQATIAAAPASACHPPGAAIANPAPDPARGRTLFSQYACTSCHQVPGVTGPRAHVGPPLQGFADRGLIAGQLPNTQENLVRWIREPQAVDAGTAMPDMQVDERDAQDMAAYLRTLR